MRTRAFPFLVVALWGLLACAAKMGPVVIGQQAPSFALEGFGGRQFSLDAPRANALVLIFSNREARQDAMLWAQRIRAAGADCQIGLIMDASGRGAGRRGTPGGMGPGGRGLPGEGTPGGRGGRGGPRGAVRDSMADRTRESGVQILIDEDGKVTKRWIGKDRACATVVVVSQENAIRAFVRDEPTPLAVDDVVSAVEELSRTDRPVPH